MEQLLITGGTGLIGRHLIEKIHKQYDITVISRDPARAKRLLGKDLKIISIDEVTQVDAYDGIINLAGEPIADKRWNTLQKEEIIDSRLNITTRLRDLINNAKTKPKVFISGSAIGVYGRQGDTPINEDFKDYHKEFSSDLCSQWEQIALTANTRVCITRTGIVLDEDGGALAKMLMPFRLGLGGPIADGTQFMSWIHIEDLANLFLYVIEYNLQGVYNGVAPNPVKQGEMVKAIAKTINRPIILPKVPSFMLKLLLGDMSAVVLESQRVSSQKVENLGFQFKYHHLQPALEDLF